MTFKVIIIMMMMIVIIIIIMIVVIIIININKNNNYINNNNNNVDVVHKIFDACYLETIYFILLTSPVVGTTPAKGGNVCRVEEED